MVFGTTHQAVINKDLDAFDSENGKLSTASSFNGSEVKIQKNLRNSKPPGYASELIFVMANMFMLKFYSDRFYEAMTFFLLACPLLIYLVCTLFVNLMEFIKLLHIEEMSGSLNEEEQNSIISPKQQKLLVRVFRDLCAYFGVYYLSSYLDTIFVLKDEILDKLKNDT